MKGLLLFSLLLTGVYSFSQEITYNPDSASYRISDTTLSGGKSDLHRKAQGWIIDKFGDAKQVIRLDDMDSGELTGQGGIVLENKDSCTFLIKISSRDRQYEGEIYDIRNLGKKGNAATAAAASKGSKKDAKAAKLADQKFRALLKDLQVRMKSEANYAQPSGDSTAPK